MGILLVNDAAWETDSDDESNDDVIPVKILIQSELWFLTLVLFQMMNLNMKEKRRWQLSKSKTEKQELKDTINNVKKNLMGSNSTPWQRQQ
mgnify:CR=1 FL=1